MSKQMNKGISLIVLVITVIVMLILAGTVILTITSNGIMDKAQEAVEKANLKQIEQIATLGWTEAFLKETTETKNDAYYQTEVINYLKASGVTQEELNKYTITATKSGVSVEIKGDANQLTAPSISIQGDTLTITSGDTKTENYAIYVDGELKNTISSTDNTAVSVVSNDEIYEDGVIKAGTYRFNDVLTAPGDEGDYELVFATPPLYAEDGTLLIPEMQWNTLRIFLTTYGSVTYSYVVGDESSTDVEVYTSENGWNHVAINNNNEVLNGYGQFITIPSDAWAPEEVGTWFSENVTKQEQINGVWKFKDVLTQCGTGGTLFEGDFTVKCNFNLPAYPDYGFNGYTGEHIFTCSEIYQEIRDESEMVNGVGSVLFTLTSAEPELPEYVSVDFSLPTSQYFYHAGDAPNGWDYYTSLLGDGIRTINFGTEPQYVSLEFYNWFTANADMVESSSSVDFDLTTLGLEAGSYTITVKAVANGYEDSTSSNSVIYVVD